MNKNKRMEFRTDDKTFNKATIYKKALGYTNEDVFKIGLDTICNEKRLLKARLSNLKEQNRILSETIENNKKELFKIRYELYIKNPRDLNPTDTRKLYKQFVKNYLEELKIYCKDSLTECLRIIKTEHGQKAIKEYTEEYKLNFDDFYNMLLKHLQNIL